jgi:hypothetical protein
VKFSLISASSIIALLSASIGPGHAAVLNANSQQSNIFDFVHDGQTSSDGGDVTVTSRAPEVSAVIALEASTPGLQTIGFTGRTDDSALLGRGYPQVPLGVARGAAPDDDLASSAAEIWRMDALQKSRTIGEERMASLIGTVGNGGGNSAGEKSGATVFVQEDSKVGFRDAGTEEIAPSSSSIAFANTPSSTSTATITVAASGLGRQYAGDAGYVVAANSLRAPPTADANADVTVAAAETARPTLSYNYAPPASAAPKGTAVEASFSDAITATGNLAQVVPTVNLPHAQLSEVRYPPAPGQAGRGGILTSQAQNRPARPGEIQTSQVPRGRYQPLAGVDNGNIRTSQVVPQGGARPAGVQTSENQSTQANRLQTSENQNQSAGAVQTGEASPVPGGVPGGPAPFQTSQVQRSQFQDLDNATPVRTSDAQSPSFAEQYLTSEIQRSQFQSLEASGDAKLADLVPSIVGPQDATQGDGTRMLMSSSVSANPTATAATYMANLIREAPTGPTTQSTVEAFEIAPAAGAKAQGSPTTVNEPLGGKIMASAGPLNSALALP